MTKISISVLAANRKTGATRKFNSIQLIQKAIHDLKNENVKPTIMLVAQRLKNKVGVTTIKKNWKSLNGKYEQQVPCEIVPQENAKKDVTENKIITERNNLIELHIKEWNFIIYKPQYFELRYQVDSTAAIMLYQKQFTPFYFAPNDYSYHQLIKIIS